MRSLRRQATTSKHSNQGHGIKVHNKYPIPSWHNKHMAHGLVGTNMTRLNGETVSASVKQEHYDSMLASMEQRHMTSKITRHGM